MKKFFAAIVTLIIAKYVGTFFYRYWYIKKIQSEPGISSALGILSHVRRQQTKNYATLQRRVS